jgi:hypothetical protein
MGYPQIGYGDAVGSGFYRGIARAGEEFGLQVDPGEEALPATITYLQEVVDRWPFELSERFVRYIAEGIGVATAARAANNFPSLSRDQLIGYFGHSADILDSLKHA